MLVNLRKYVMIHDINQPTWPDVKLFWDKLKVNKKYKEYLYQTNGKKCTGNGIAFLMIKNYEVFDYYTNNVVSYSAIE